MLIRTKLLLMQEIEHRNHERIKVYTKQQKRASQPIKCKAKRDKGKRRKKL